jgi:topoisomerase-4 subunit A
VDTLLVFGSAGRVYSVPVAQLPGGRGDGVPLTSLIDLEPATTIAQACAGPAEATLLLTNSGGFGLLARAADLQARNRAGKAFLTLEATDRLLPPVPVAPGHAQVGCLAQDGRLLVFGLDELKLQSGGGRGLTLMDVDTATPLVAVATFGDTLKVSGTGRGGKPKEELLRATALAGYAGKRARKGRKLEGWVKALRLG